MDFNRPLLTEGPAVFLKKPVVSLVCSHYLLNFLKVFFCQQFRSDHLLDFSASLVFCVNMYRTLYTLGRCKGMNKKLQLISILALIIDQQLRHHAEQSKPCLTKAMQITEQTGTAKLGW